MTFLAALLLAASGAIEAQSAGTLTKNDYTEIHELYARYAQAYDSANKEGYSGVFTPDGVFVVGPRTMTGAKEIQAMITAAPRERPKITHVNTNIVIDPTPEGAKGSVYVILMDLQKNPAITGGGVYEDTLVRTKDGWRFKKRVFYPEAPAAPAKTTNQ
jgi:uncharacterized protein (TIGR02246 family)